MKTITQLRAQLREAAEHIEALSQELGQLQPSHQKKSVDFAHIQAIGKRYPIKDHCLTQENTGFQQQYLTLLAAPLLLESKEPENGWLFLQRILAGIGCTIPLVDLQADAASLTDQQLDAFSAAVLERNLANALMLDAMLLCLSCKGVEAMWDWLAGLAELLGCTLAQVQELAELAALIVREDKEGLRAFTKRNLLVDLSSMNCYIFLILDWYFQVKRQTLFYYGDGHTPLLPSRDIPKITNVKVSRIEIHKAIFEGERLYLDAGERQLVLEDCIVRNINNLESCFDCRSKLNIVLRRCSFEQLVSGDYTIQVKNCRSLILENVDFCNIKCTNYGGDAIDFGACQCQMYAVTMDNIQGRRYWYRGIGGTATPDCYYKNCVGQGTGLPNGFREKTEK